MSFSIVCCIFSFSQSGCSPHWMPSRVHVLPWRLPVLAATATSGTWQRAGKTQSIQRSFARAEIPFSYQAPPGNHGRRRAKWNKTGVQRHVDVYQPQLAFAAPAPSSPPWHRTSSQPLAEPINLLQQPPWLETVSPFVMCEV